MKNLSNTDYPPYFANYINLVDSNSVLESLTLNLTSFVSFIEAIEVEKHNFKYQEDKWTVKDVVQHVIDTERIFAYRALCFARLDKTELPGFDEDSYAKNVHTKNTLMTELVEEFILVRKSTIKLFESFTENMLNNIGKASGKNMSVLAIGFVITGHAMHHTNVISERYLK